MTTRTPSNHETHIKVSAPTIFFIHPFLKWLYQLIKGKNTENRGKEKRKKKKKENFVRSTIKLTAKI
jgi:hypothetical protein